ncbi:hypothetical protein [Oceanicella actignis]|uniref:Uncharacterized protein n=1 Tax=Oceanicella actignis TaxID=1189325 RepID=A0A1M7RZK2_9RHOB|nr:hypothetical protein [Oceanicella actignis]SES94926.1 hypothetical protein SAMN04488119_102176 [Oceanicella actignis]SHN51596.1 hypothetical protein SAMN05216200_101342 [Oceanicella actignis]
MMKDWPLFFRNLALGTGAACAAFFAALWLLSGRIEFLGAVGGVWALGQLFAALAAFAGRRAAMRAAPPAPADPQWRGGWQGSADARR